MFQINQETLGPEHVDVAADLHRLGVVLNRRGAFAEAEFRFRSAHDILIKNHGRTSVDLVPNLSR